MDPRSLATFRISLALVVLFDLQCRARDISFFYTDEGVLPRNYILAALQPWDVSLHLMSGAWQIQAVLFLLAAIAATAMLVGYRTSEATVWTWVLTMSLQDRNPLILQGGDGMIRVVLFWAVFLPTARVWSIDVARKDNDAADVAPVFSVATFCLIVQAWFIYMFASLHKTGEAWRVSGDAVFYALSNDQLSTSFGRWLLQFPELLRGVTFATLPFEMYGPLLLVVPFATGYFRLIACVLFLGFHIILAITMELGPFPYVGIALWTAFLPAMVWNRLRIPPLPRLWPPESDRHSSFFRAVRGTLLLFVLVHVAFWNLRNLDERSWSEIYPRSDDYVLKLLGVDQNWAMFSPYPLTGDGWFQISARTASDRIVNLSPGAAPDDPITEDRPRSINEMYPNERWRKFMMMLVTPEGAGWRPPFIRALALKWRREHPSDPLKSLDLHFFQEVILPNCESTPVEKLLLAHSDAPEFGG
ncbi:MAG: HTTM domain-containing protein [Deltaproteobacteria bacterium]|nr:HTTM domain-containing protein [Deltaproteobacteria bacterium]